jgi:predicted nucleic acid-binding protein
VQALNEFTGVVRRKLSWDWTQVDAALAGIAELTGPARPLTADIHTHALELARDSTLSFYDALVIAAAADARCRVLLTEDPQHGRQFGGVTVENPFLEEP